MTDPELLELAADVSRRFQGYVNSVLTEKVFDALKAVERKTRVVCARVAREVAVKQIKAGNTAGGGVADSVSQRILAGERP